jgi:hypothetical protein
MPARILCGLGGALLLAMALGILFCPPTKGTTTYDDSGAIKTRVIETIDASVPFVSLLIAGLGLLIFGINGLRITKVSAGDYSAEAGSVRKKAEEFHLAAEEQRPESPVAVPDKDSPEPSDVPIATVKSKEGDVAIYSLSEVPTAVIADALAHWPENEPKPDDLSSFEFASRATGKGNHPWVLKFKGKKAVVVTYGGHAKRTPTVAAGGT